MAAAAVTSLPDLRSPLNQEAFALWNAKRGGERMPRRIDLIEMASFMDSVVLIDVLSDPRDFYYRFVGSRIDDFLSTPLTGRTMLAMPHQRPPSRIWSATCKVVDTGEPVSGDVPYVGPKCEFTAMEDLVMPVAADGKTVSSIIVTADFFQPAPRHRPGLR